MYWGYFWACSELVSQAETRKCSNCVSWPFINFFCVERGNGFFNADIKEEFFSDVTIGNFLKLEIIFTDENLRSLNTEIKLNRGIKGKGPSEYNFVLL